MCEKYILALLVCFLFASSCVQKAYNKTVVLTLTVKDKKDIKTIGIRGGTGTLSWDKDYLMTEVIKDSIYTSTISGRTGFKFAEIKFTLNGEFELKDKPNRKIYFSDKDTTLYKATFNQDN
jgi:hypothetical protein